MSLLQPSFRGRLRLFFAVIVIVPIIAAGVVLFQLLGAGDDFKLDSSLGQAQTTAQALYRDDRNAASAALQSFARSRELATAINRRQTAVVQREVKALARRAGVVWIELRVGRSKPFTVGDSTAIAAARFKLQAAGGGGEIGQITASTTTARDYAVEVNRLTQKQ